MVGCCRCQLGVPSGGDSSYFRNGVQSTYAYASSRKPKYTSTIGISIHRFELFQKGSSRFSLLATWLLKIRLHIPRYIHLQFAVITSTSIVLIMHK